MIPFIIGLIVGGMTSMFIMACILVIGDEK